MATGRIGVTPTLGTRWSKAPAGGTTSLSGLDDNSVSLVYSVGYEQVYRNGVLLSRGNDYTATTGNSITLIDATIAGDIIEVFANQLVPLTDAISKGQFTAKGALLSATAASTPAVLTVGSNDQVLTADSSTSTGLKWATPSAGGMTLLSTTTLSGSETIISSINQGYNTLRIWIYGVTNATANGIFFFQVRNSTTALDWNGIGPALNSMPADIYSSVGTRLSTDSDGLRLDRTNATNFWVMEINNYASTTDKKHLSVSAGYYDNTVSKYVGRFLDGVVQSNSAIDSLRLWNNAGDFNSGTVKIYGVK